MANIHEQIETNVELEKYYQIRKIRCSETKFLEALSSKYGVTGRYDSLIDMGNERRSEVISTILFSPRAGVDLEIIYDYLRLTADEDLFIQALIARHAKLIAICLPRVVVTPRLRTNCPKDLRYLLTT